MKSFEDFTVMKSIKRMAIQYEDDAYTHFILNKLMIAGDFGFNSKTYCVIPCRNISHDELYLDDFSFFDFVVFNFVTSTSFFSDCEVSFVGNLSFSSEKHFFASTKYRSVCSMWETHI